MIMIATTTSPTTTRTAGVEYEVDCIVMATGFETGYNAAGMGAPDHGLARLCRVIPDCHPAVQLSRFIPGFLSCSAAVFLK
jgi:hypothetical protein